MTNNVIYKQGLKPTILLILALLLFNPIIDCNEVYAKKHKSSVSKSKSKKKKKKSKKQVYPSETKIERIGHSLLTLDKYCPEYASVFKKKRNIKNAFVFESDSVDETSMFSDPKLRKELLFTIHSWLGTNYRHGGHSKRGVDCSNFVNIMVTKTLGVQFPASPGAQASLFKKIDNSDDLLFGDLVFFSHKNQSRISHVGIYIKNGVFAHSSSAKRGRGVVYNHLSDGKYAFRFRFGGRFYKNDWIKT